MRLVRRSLQSAALTDVMFLVGLAPSSIAPITVAELHLYAYIANLVALNGGIPIADWGYAFSLTSDGFPFAHDLEAARENLGRRCILREQNGCIIPEEDLYSAEMSIIESLVQSVRRKEWLIGALACVLNLPKGATRDAVNQSPGVAASLRQGRATALLQDGDVATIYTELAQVKAVLGDESYDSLQPVVIWLSAYVLSNKWALC